VIRGSVNRKLEAVVRLSIRGPRKEVEAEAILDTGFNGSLVLPPELIEELGLRRTTDGRAVLADGSKKFFDIYEALIFWDGRLLRILVGAVDNTPLLDMSLLHGSELAIQVVEGGEVFVRDLESW
jgi:clan AA aspartic protease